MNSWMSRLADKAVDHVKRDAPDFIAEALAEHASSQDGGTTPEQVATCAVVFAIKGAIIGGPVGAGVGAGIAVTVGTISYVSERMGRRRLL